MIEQNRSAAGVHLALAAAALLFSANYIVAKIALEHFDPFAFVWLRMAGAALLLQLVLRGRGHRAILPRGEWRSAALYAFLGVVVNQLMFITGLSLTTAHEAAILITTIPIFTLIAAVVLKSESVRFINVLGILIAAAGALLILSPENHTQAAGNRVLGGIFLLINCASYGIYLVVSRPLMRRQPVGTAVSHLFLTGSIILIPFCLPALLETGWSAIPVTAWSALIAVIVGPTVAAYLLNGWALARADSTLVAAYTYAQPFIAALLAAALLGERITLLVVAAAVLIVTGVLLASSSPRGVKAPPLEHPDSGM